jgi:geranylgeranyl diphosphate synthase type I
MGAGWDVQAGMTRVRDISARIDQGLRAFVDKQRLGDFYELMRYELGWQRGPEAPPPVRARSVLCVLACEASGGTLEAALPVAMAVALLHNFSLIQEDMEHGREVNRGRPSVWRLWGSAQAMNAGDGMHALSKMALLECRAHAPAGATLHLQEELDEACLRLFEALQQELLAPQDCSAEDTAVRKGAVLFGCAAYAGCYLAGGSEAARGAMRRFGELAGSASAIRRINPARASALADSAETALAGCPLDAGPREALSGFCRYLLQSES